MDENPFTQDTLPLASKDSLSVGLLIEQAAVFIAQAAAGGVIGNAFYQFLADRRQRKGQQAIRELQQAVYEELKKVKRKPGVSNEDLRLRVDQHFTKFNDQYK